MKKQFLFTAFFLLAFSISNAQSHHKKNYKKEINENTRTLTCQYCGKKFKQERSIVSTMMGNMEVWEGGFNHCDPKWSSRPGNNLTAMSEALKGCVSKYCSRKCSCDAGED